MFTGIINNLGKLDRLEKNIFTFSASRLFCKKIKPGDSVSVNGICLTVEKKNRPDTFSVSVMPETQKRTALNQLKLEEYANLELPLSINKFLSGHFVQGHIDGTGVV